MIDMELNCPPLIKPGLFVIDSMKLPENFSFSDLQYGWILQAYLLVEFYIYQSDKFVKITHNIN